MSTWLGGPSCSRSCPSPPQRTGVSGPGRCRRPCMCVIPNKHTVLQPFSWFYDRGCAPQRGTSCGLSHMMMRQSGNSAGPSRLSVPNAVTYPSLRHILFPHFFCVQPWHISIICPFSHMTQCTTPRCWCFGVGSYNLRGFHSLVIGRSFIGLKGDTERGICEVEACTVHAVSHNCLLAGTALQYRRASPPQHIIMAARQRTRPKERSSIEWEGV